MLIENTQFNWVDFSVDNRVKQKGSEIDYVSQRPLIYIIHQGDVHKYLLHDSHFPYQLYTLSKGYDMQTYK